MSRLLFLVGVWLITNSFAFNRIFIFNQNAKLLNKERTYTLSLNDEQDIFVKNNVDIKLMIPKEKCNYEFLKNIYFVNSDSNDEIYVDNYHVDYYQKSLKKICIANYHIPKQRRDILYRFIYGNLSQAILSLEKSE